jgi:hypothetical protein
MGGVAIVLVLAGLVIPISLLLLAVVFDAVVVAWALFRAWHDNVSPRIMSAVHGAHLPRFLGNSDR